MDAAPATSCAHCARLQRRIDELEQLVASLAEQLRQVQEKLAAAAKDSSTSSKPPSSDIVKPPKPDPPPGQTKRPPGGQPGHPKHQRAAFGPEQVNGGFFEHLLDCCPDCGCAVAPVQGPPRVVQQMDIRLIPVVVE
jgi:transposase